MNDSFDTAWYEGNDELFDRIEAFDWNSRVEIREEDWAPWKSTLKAVESPAIETWSSTDPISAEEATARFLTLYPEPKLPEVVS